MIKVELLKYKSQQQELQVVQLVRDYHQEKKPTGIFEMELKLYTVQNNLTSDIEKVPRKNCHSANLAYKVVRDTDDKGQHLKVIHRTVEGDADRFIAIIRDDEKPFNNW